MQADITNRTTLISIDGLTVEAYLSRLSPLARAAFSATLAETFRNNAFFLESLQASLAQVPQESHAAMIAGMAATFRQLAEELERGLQAAGTTGARVL